jgi:hypothetical protein
LLGLDLSPLFLYKGLIEILHKKKYLNVHVKNLKNSKACGDDCIINEYIKSTIKQSVY